jgi:Endosomal/lysosomal potassium channel TMEM175
MLPARRHEITRVEAFSDAVFAFALTLLVVSLEVPDSYDKLGAGFVVIFLMFGLLYLQAYRKRDELKLTPLEVFDTRAAGGEHLVSVSIGALATLVALTTPPPYPVFSGFTYFLMGPAHWIYGMRIGKRRREFLTGVGAGDAPATT